MPHHESPKPSRAITHQSGFIKNLLPAKLQSPLLYYPLARSNRLHPALTTNSPLAREIIHYIRFSNCACERTSDTTNNRAAKYRNRSEPTKRNAHTRAHSRPKYVNGPCGKPRPAILAPSSTRVLFFPPRR